MSDAEREALSAMLPLPCPACGNPRPACRPHRTFGSRIECARCGAVGEGTEDDDNDDLRGPWLRWNAWCRRAQRVREAT